MTQNKFLRVYEHEARWAAMRNAGPELYSACSAAFDFLGGMNGAVEIRGQLLAALASVDRNPEGGNEVPSRSDESAVGAAETP